jgi:hypothetical protein
VTRFVWFLVAVLAARAGVPGVLVDVVTAAPDLALGALVVFAAARGAFRADRPAGYTGMLPRYVR